MQEYKQMPPEMKKKAEKLIQNAELLTAASITEEGYPYPCILALLSPSKLNEVVFSTGTSSKKTAHFISNPKAGVTIQHGQDSLVLTGHIQIIDDIAVKEMYWQEWMIDHFPQGVSDPEYCLMRFIPNHVVVWIEGFFERYQL